MEGQNSGGGISPYPPPWIRHCAHYEDYLQMKAKRGEYTITIVFGSFYLCLLYFNDYRQNIDI